MVAKKRGKKRTGNPARSRFVIGRGGGRRSVVTFLFWNGAQWRRRWFIPWVSASIFGRICAHRFHFPNRRKVSELEWNSKLSNFFFFLSRLLSFSRSGYISPRHCVHCVDRSTIPRDISSSSSFFLLRLASQFASSFDIRHFIIVSFLFFLLDLRILSSSRYFIKFCIVFHTVFFSIKKKKKNTDGRKIYSTWYLKRQFFGRRGQTGYELQSRTSTRPTFHV